MDSNNSTGSLDLDDQNKQLQNLNSMEKQDKDGPGRDQQSTLQLDGNDESQSNDDSKSTQEAAGNWLARVPEVLERQQGSISLESMSKDLHQTLQTDVNICTKRNTGPITVFDLPDELLMHIFDYVRGYPTRKRCFGQPRKTNDIKNVRLTCKRFCGASSHLLVHFLVLGVDQESLNLLSDASSHPIISKGIECIELSLRFYVAEMAPDIVKCTSESVSDLMKITSRTSLSFIYDEDLEEIEKASQAMIELKSILESWQVFSWGVPDDKTSFTARLHEEIAEESSGHFLLLKNAHERYQYRFSEQQELLKENKFVKAMATALSHMPMARMLELHDRDLQYERGNIPFQSVKGWINGATNHSELVRHMVHPMSFKDTNFLEFRAPAPNLLLKMPITLPIAIHKAGIWLTKFAIEMSSVDLSLLSMSADEEIGLQAAMQRLTSFDFLPDSKWSGDSDIERSEIGIKHLRKYLRAIIDNDTLEDLSLDFESHWNMSINMGALLSFRCWPKLSSLYIDGMPLRLTDIQKFTEQLRGDVPYLFMRWNHLLTGTWAEVLDTLRTKANNGWHLYGACGAEGDVLSDNEMNRIFVGAKEGTFQFHVPNASMAEQFIHGEIDQNPLRA